MLRPILNRRVLAIMIVGIAAVPILGYMVFVFPNRTQLELSKLKHEHIRRGIEVGRIYRELGKSPELSKAEADFEAWQDKARTRCMRIAAANSDNRSGATALLMVMGRWPDSSEAQKAHAKLLELTETLPMDDLAWALNDGMVGEIDHGKRRTIAAHLIERVRVEPDHQDTAWVLSRTSCLVDPKRYSVTGPCEEFVAIAELIRNKYAAHENISNFCEMLGEKGRTSEWALAYEPHLREILAVNQDRFVRCSAKFNLACVVKAGGRERQAEAKQLFEEFLDEFDGKVEYHAQGVETSNRGKAREILWSMRLSGTPAFPTAGVDLNGQPMSLDDYKGKVVLLSFWATWCGPCMRAIPHEKELVEHFDASDFAIVGVNGDTEKTDRALAAVQEHGITWQSFQRKSPDGSWIDRDWHIGGWPTFYLLDQDGTISNRWSGMPAQATMQQAIAELIAKAKSRAPVDASGVPKAAEKSGFLPDSLNLTSLFCE